MLINPVKLIYLARLGARLCTRLLHPGGSNLAASPGSNLIYCHQPGSNPAPPHPATTRLDQPPGCVQPLLQGGRSSGCLGVGSKGRSGRWYARSSQAPPNPPLPVGCLKLLPAKTFSLRTLDAKGGWRCVPAWLPSRTRRRQLLGRFDSPGSFRFPEGSLAIKSYPVQAFLSCNEQCLAVALQSV